MEEQVYHKRASNKMPTKKEIDAEWGA